MNDILKSSEILALKEKKNVVADEIKSALANDLMKNVGIDSHILIPMIDRVGLLEGEKIISEAIGKQLTSFTKILLGYDKDHDKTAYDKAMKVYKKNVIELGIVQSHWQIKVTMCSEKIRKFEEEMNNLMEPDANKYEKDNDITNKIKFRYYRDPLKVKIGDIGNPNVQVIIDSSDRINKTTVDLENNCKNAISKELIMDAFDRINETMVDLEKIYKNAIPNMKKKQKKLVAILEKGLQKIEALN